MEMGKVDFLEKIILGIDTSCDETSVSITKGFSVLANVNPSQIREHQKFGGVVPSLARLLHKEKIDQVLNKALQRAGITLDQVELIAVTVGPGIAIALEVGIAKAKELASKYKLPIIAVNHMEGHLYSALLKPSTSTFSQQENQLENLLSMENSLGILVSGKHTEVVKISQIFEYEILGETLDDACGEAFDKAGRALGLGYPAGPIVSKFAKENRKNISVLQLNKNQTKIVQIKSEKNTLELPIPLSNSKDMDFSFSGLKTAFKKLIETNSGQKITVQDELNPIFNLDQKLIFDLCSVFEEASFSHLEDKVTKALTNQKFQNIFLGGGVVASPRFRYKMRKLAKNFGTKLFTPLQKRFITDNASMISMVGGLNYFFNPKAQIFSYSDLEKIDRIPSLRL